MHRYLCPYLGLNMRGFMPIFRPKYSRIYGNIYAINIRGFMHISASPRYFDPSFVHGFAGIPRLPLSPLRCSAGAKSATRCCWQWFRSDPKVSKETPVSRHDPPLESFKNIRILKGFAPLAEWSKNITFLKVFSEIPNRSCMFWTTPAWTGWYTFHCRSCMLWDDFLPIQNLTIKASVY